MDTARGAGDQQGNTSVGELAERVGITPTNLAELKSGRAGAVCLTTLAALCEVLECRPGELLRGKHD
ncbi:helix-turn-helix domain-containing protein [Streptomyces europaeiscabiei]|uniref:Helix-turn-helix domain-containing protein n=1 Tax=Streptomyces europaeiscabiei TaxID=146819 RepID=A0AAJ2UH25_9ACTN|nr:helix-turn-helix domain-containing protein [Streptomyces europaeiscabiei]MDX3128248.1 helix-turn-helix domain-containing protein [Streptomyces europaeiscabiei]